MFRTIEKIFPYDPESRKFKMEYWRRECLPYWLCFERSDQLAPVTIAAVGAPSPRVGYRPSYSSCDGLDRSLGNPLEVQSLLFADSTDSTAAANFTVRMTELGNSRQFMNNPIHIRCLAGTAQRPFILRHPFFFPSLHTVSVEFNKVAGGATTARMYMAGTRYYPFSPEFLRFPEERKKMEDYIRKWMRLRNYVTPYWMTTDISPVVIGGGVGVVAQATLKNGDDGWMEVFGLTAVSTGNFLMSILEVKTSQTIMNGEISQVNGIGTAEMPTCFPTPYLLAPGKRFRVVLTNQGGPANTVFLTFFGRRIYANGVKVRDVINELSVATPADTPTPLVPAPLARG
jgi:hypothetical protein